MKARPSYLNKVTNSMTINKFPVFKTIPKKIARLCKSDKLFSSRHDTLPDDI